MRKTGDRPRAADPNRRARRTCVVLTAAVTALVASAAAWAACPATPDERAAIAMAIETPPRTHVLCAESGGSSARVPKVKPSRCDTYGPGESFATSANLIRLRWRGWGRSVATATGIERGYHLPYSRIRVRVRAYGRRRACGGYLYTRLLVRSRHGRLLVKFPTSCR